MARDEQAEAMWRAAYVELTAGRPGLLGKMLARAEPQTMRLACIYAMLDASPVVRVEHLEAALAVWDYAEASARFVFGDSLGDRDAEKLLEAIREANGGLTRKQITKDVFAGNMKRAAIGEKLTRLLNEGLIHRVTPEPGKPGRPIERWAAGHLQRAQN